MHAGVVMTMADGATTRMRLVGPPGLLHYLATMRFCVYRCVEFTSLPSLVFLILSRPQIAMYPTEASLTPDLSSTPNPVYKDDNISVYSIPILPTSTELHIDSSESSSKRKRVDSPVSFSKRARAPSTPQSNTLQAIINQQDFLPESLEGKLAQEWRQQMLQTMFPKSREPEEVKGPSKFEKRKAAKEAIKQAAAAGPSVETATTPVC